MSVSEAYESANDHSPPASDAHEVIESVDFSDLVNHGGPSSCLSDFTKEYLLEQIEIETVSLRTCELKIEEEHSASETDVEEVIVLSNRINKLYETLFKTYEIDVTVVSDYIKFGSNSKVMTSKFRNVLDELMESFRIDPEVYIIGACYVFNDCHDIGSARRFLANGISFHRNYKGLFLEEFDIELKHLILMESTSLDVIMDKYNHLINHFKDDINLHLALVDKVFEHSVVGKLHSVVIRDVVNKYKLNEKMWQKLANIHLKGFTYNFKSGLLDFCENELTCIRNCITIYERTLEKSLFPDNQQILWHFFLDIVIQINKTANMKDKPIKDFLTKKTNDIFHEALKKGTLNKAEYFIFWASISDENTQLVILKKSVTVLRKDVQLWEKLLGFFLYRDFYEGALSVFQESIHILKDDGISLWDIMELYLLNTEDSMINKFYEQAAFDVHYKGICNVYRPKYLEWCLLKDGVKSGRKIFLKIKDLEPPCKELYKDMIKAEILCCEDRSKRMTHIRSLYNEACHKFGIKDIELWVDCIRFEYTHGLPSCVDIILKAAFKVLDPALKSSLIQAKKELDKEFSTSPGEDLVIEISDDDIDDNNVDDYNVDD